MSQPFIWRSSFWCWPAYGTWQAFQMMLGWQHQELFPSSQEAGFTHRSAGSCYEYETPLMLNFLLVQHIIWVENVRQLAMKRIPIIVMELYGKKKSCFFNLLAHPAFAIVVWSVENLWPDPTLQACQSFSTDGSHFKPRTTLLWTMLTILCISFKLYHLRCKNM